MVAFIQRKNLQRMPNQQYQEPEVWTAAIVEITLLSGRRDVMWHQFTRKAIFIVQRLKDKAQDLFDLELECRPSDWFLFPSNTTKFLATSQATSISQWLVTSKRAIKHSISQAAKEASSRTRSIWNWFNPVIPIGNNQGQRQQDRLIHDSYSKKKRHKIDRTIQSNRIDKLM